PVREKRKRHKSPGQKARETRSDRNNGHAEMTRTDLTTSSESENKQRSQYSSEKANHSEAHSADSRPSASMTVLKMSVKRSGLAITRHFEQTQSRASRMLRIAFAPSFCCARSINSVLGLSRENRRHETGH